ncbi:hypothetical protein H6F89_15670 [Cyanobacteria bacterium FACHB-63]|nr:hypothetical protein [Cyanobacteria bacterium FACHB-63]
MNELITTIEVAQSQARQIYFPFTLTPVHPPHYYSKAQATIASIPN